MSTIVTRAGKGSSLTWTEMDANLTNLNTDKLETSAIGSTVQAHSANLDEYAAVNPTAAGLAILDDATAADQRVTLGLEIGVNVQAYDADLTTLGAGGAAARSFLGLAIGTDVQAYSANANRIVQVVEATPITSVVTCSTAMPLDNTIPQNTEGNEVITVSITPTSATNRLLIEFNASCCGMGASSYVTSALFKDTTADALAVGSTYIAGGAVASAVLPSIVHEMVAGGTSAITFKVRAGASGATIYVNGDNTGTRVFGGIAAARLRVTEIRV